MGKVQVFLDADVITSALLSETGASYEVIKNLKVKKIISKTVEKEVKEVTKRLNIDSQDIKKVFKNVKSITLNLTKNNLLKSYQDYVFDEKDSHVVAGAHKSKSKFLLTHNTKHYKADKIKSNLKIIILKPGNFLQYLRSINKF